MPRHRGRSESAADASIRPAEQLAKHQTKNDHNQDDQHGALADNRQHLGSMDAEQHHRTEEQHHTAEAIGNSTQPW